MFLSKLNIILQNVFKNCQKPFLNSHKTLAVKVVRTSHTDIKVPDFSHYRRASVKSPESITRNSDDNRKTFTVSVATIAGIMTLYATKAEIHRYVLFMAASADVLALAKIEIKLSEIPEGKNVTFKWRGKPLFIRHRNEEQIKGARDVSLSILRDPASDEDRCTNPKFLVVLGVCTHLGCVPIADAGDFGPGGYYCPCHGAHFDAAGRVRKGPAPINLVVPEHHYVGDDTLIVG